MSTLNTYNPSGYKIPVIQSEPRQLYLVSEVADALRWHNESVRRAIRAGRIKAIKTGRIHKVPADELARLIEKGL